MPITYTIDSDRGFVRALVTGSLADTDPIGFVETLLEHPAYRPGISTLAVCEDLSVGSFSSDAVARLASFTKKAKYEPSRVAVVAAQPVVYGLARMYQLLRSPSYDFCVFENEAEAIAWLVGGAQAANV